MYIYMYVHIYIHTYVRISEDLSVHPRLFFLEGDCDARMTMLYNKLVGGRVGARFGNGYRTLLRYNCRVYEEKKVEVTH
jgi:hypothetical protein